MTPVVKTGPKDRTNKKMATVLSQWFYQCSQSYFVGETCRRFVAPWSYKRNVVFCGDRRHIRRISELLMLTKDKTNWKLVQMLHELVINNYFTFMMLKDGIIYGTSIFALTTATILSKPYRVYIVITLIYFVDLFVTFSISPASIA